MRQIAFAALLLPHLAFAETMPSLAPQIVATATGEARLRPDRANVLVGVQTRAKTAAAAARENNTRQQAVIDAIVAAGIPREQISTENYNVTADTRIDKPGQNPVVVGYVVTNVVRVEVRRIEQVGPVIDAALGKGANQIDAVDWFSSNTDAARRQALADAVAKARGDADAMARAGGGKLGPLLEIATSDDLGGPRPLYRSAMSAQAATPIEAGELTVQVHVRARWHFVANP
ncbi:MAG: SIMPL domain-containing protein [Myxococcales bacterium]